MIKQPLNLIHKDLVTPKLKSLELCYSFTSFSNLYLWRHTHHSQLIEHHGTPFIEGVLRDGTPFLLPLEKPDPSMLKLLDKDQVLYPIPDKWLSLFAEDTIEKSFLPEESDYVYATEKIRTYPGRRLSKKRNLLAQLFRDHQVKSEPFGEQHKELALQLLDGWKKAQGDGEADYGPCREAIELFTELGLEGRAVSVDDLFAGFTIGEWISPCCYVIHFAKGYKHLNGLYPFMYQDVAKNLSSDLKWINLEEDLGIDALKQAKHSYQPDKLGTRWRLRGSKGF